MKKPSQHALNRADVVRRKLSRHEYRRAIRRLERKLQRRLAIDKRRAYAIRNQVYFDPRLDRAQIILPTTLSLTTNYLESINVIAEMRHFALTEGRPVMLHFTSLESIEPAAALVLVAEIYRLRNLRGENAVTGTYPNDRRIYELLSDMGFFSLLRIVERSDIPRSKPDPGRPIFLRFISNNRVEAREVDRFVGIIENHILKLNDLARERLVAAIVEAMANTLDHAHPNPVPREDMRNRWWLSSWVSLLDNEVTIVIFDQGVGIPNTLDPTAYDIIRAALANISQFKLSAKPSDGEMILAATEYHRSGSGQTGRGRGFADMKRFVDICTDGELRVLSNRGSYHYLPGREACDDAKVSLGGTLIEWRFRHDGIVELSDG